MERIYIALLVMSAVTTALYLLLKLCGKWTRRYFTGSWHYYSYSLLYTFFLIPYFTLLSLFNIDFAKAIPGLIEARSVGELTFSPVSQAKSGDGASRVISFLLDGLPYLLLTGTVVFIAVIVLQNIRLHRRVFRICELADDPDIIQEFAACRKELGIARDIPVYLSPYVSTPFLYGMVKPRIVLPAAMEFTPAEYRQVFLHELTHYQRHDVWIKSLFLVVNAMHWFNPFAYIARRDIDRYCELACDEKLIQSMDQDERKRYCKLLLTVLWNVADQRVSLYSAFSSERKYLERRIHMILKNEGSKKTKRIRTLAIVMTLSVALIGTAAAYAGSSAVPQQQSFQDEIRTPRSDHNDPNYLKEGGRNIHLLDLTDGTIESYDQDGNKTVKRPQDLTNEELSEEVERLRRSDIPVPQPYLDILNKADPAKLGE